MLPAPPVRPYGRRLLVLRDAVVEVSKGGVILPDVAKKKALKGTVLAAGTGCEHKRGDRIFFGFLSGIEVDLDDGCDRYLMLMDTDVILEDES